MKDFANKLGNSAISELSKVANKSQQAGLAAGNKIVQGAKHLDPRQMSKDVDNAIEKFVKNKPAQDALKETAHFAEGCLLGVLIAGAALSIGAVVGAAAAGALTTSVATSAVLSGVLPAIPVGVGMTIGIGAAHAQEALQANAKAKSAQDLVKKAKKLEADSKQTTTDTYLEALGIDPEKLPDDPNVKAAAKKYAQMFEQLAEKPFDEASRRDMEKAREELFTAIKSAEQS